MRPAQRTDQPLTLHYRRVAIAESLIQLDVWLLGLALAHWGTSLREPLPTVIAVAASSRTEQSSPDLAGLPREHSRPRETAEGRDRSRRAALDTCDLRRDVPSRRQWVLSLRTR